MLNAPESTPKNALLLPVVVLLPELVPKNELRNPLVFDCPAPLPTNVPLPPADKFATPAFVPTNVFALPGTLNTRLPAMLYCVVALTMFDESVPPAMPLPVMLKSDEAC